MNKSYISIWNEALGSWVAASENMSVRGKRSKSRTVAGTIATALVLAGMSGTAASAVIGTPVEATNGSYSGTDTDSASATGDDAVAVGAGATASAQGTTALGAASVAGGQNATAIGIQATASEGSNAIGWNTTASGIGSTAIGQFANAAGAWSTALGFEAEATNDMSIAIGTLAAANADNSVALGAYSVADRANVVSVGSAGLTRQITNVAAGTEDSDAVVVSQLKNVTTALGGGAAVNADGSIASPAYNVGGTAVDNVGDAIINLDGRTTQNTSQITSLLNGSAGPVQQDASTRAITVAKDMDGTAMNVAGTAGNRTVTGVANGAVRATSVDAVNGSQLYGTAWSTARALGGGSIVLADGSISAPKFSVGGTTVYSVAEAVTNLDGRTTQNTGDIAQNATNIASVQNQLSEGTVGLVQQDANTRDITVAKDMDGTVVNVAGAAGNRTVTGVANGAVNASSVDAINGSQLYGAASSTAEALGGGSTVNADGTLSAPSYSVGGTTVHSVGDAVTNIDGRTTQNTEDITKLQTQVGDVGAQLSGAVQYDRKADGSVNLGAVTLGGSQSAGPVILTNVANGTSQYDAVNFGQLSALQDQVTDLNGQVWNLGSQLSNGQPGSSNSDASNGPSSGGGNDAVVNAAAPGIGAASTVAGAGAAASGDNATAVGANAAATGANSTAIGTGSQAANANSVALGQGSVTDRDNSVSVGSATQQRQITNVAAGTADTDAVNVGQMNSSVAQGVQQANNYTDQRINATNQAINDVAKNAYAGIAAAMAMPNMTPSGPGKTIVAAGGATYKGGSAAAVGATYRSRNNKWLVNAAMSVTSTGDAGVRAQVGYEF
ncbi:YadA-like family protein [Paraburkholderia atlantica]|uniref:YadA-like family protein n=1 Tax=Paraburkholderia atlantica TaxID=2654982 RepID=UPI00160C0471|nr:YadA-like family protein [Paraburkholderia atlantica]MBB5419807.1 autotransporter adhesin [Paraburkholderia atlantica]